MAGWASSDGAKFHTYNDRLHGIKLPYRQRHLGDQWSDVIVRHPYPFAMVLSMGSNDIPDMYRILMHRRLQDKKTGNTGTETRWFHWAFKLAHYPRTKYFFINIIDRPGWPPVECCLAKWVGDYMKCELGFSVIDANSKIHRGHILERDLVHLNRIGCHRFYETVTRPISTSYMQWPQHNKECRNKHPT